MAQPEVYLLGMHEPYTDPAHPVPIDGLIVHAQTLLHLDVPQPDGGMMYRCLTEFPGRRAGEIVPVSTLTHELDGGRLWPQIADWMGVVGALVALHRRGGCDAMPLGLPQRTAMLLAGGPQTIHRFYDPDQGSTVHLGPVDRQSEIDVLGGHLTRWLAEGPLWPGDHLRAPPRRRLPIRQEHKQRRVVHENPT